MAAELVGGAFISGAVQLLLERIASPEVINYFLGNKDCHLDGLLKRLKAMVSSLTAVLDDAEQRQIRNDPRVEAWLDDVQEAVFDADDLLDEIETDALQQKVEGESRAGTSEVSEAKRKKIFNLFARSSKSNDGDMESKIKKIVDRLEEIAKQKDCLCLKAGDVEEKPWRKLPSTSLVKESEVYGRDDDKVEMIKLLLSDDVDGEKICVVPIVGMAGVGKTTLAQAVFNDNEVKYHFDTMAWVCVSEEYDVLRVTSAILKSVSKFYFLDNVTDLNSLQVKLTKELTEKKFLIVLDDVWNESYLDWDILRMPFKDGARGSKIIVSTRSNKVANVMGTVPSHQLTGLSEEACWQIFARHASGIGDFTRSPELERIGRDIIGKCKGLPLAVKTLGGLLRSTLNVREWERVSKSDIWEFADVESKILPALRLSYYYLPSPLKRCFAYCSIFPKDYEFEKEELILLWMAENLLQDPKKKKSMEEVGSEYFDDLVSRSFLQKSRKVDQKSCFVMHDLFVDLAKFVSGHYCFLLETSGGLDEVVKMQTRHLAYVSEQCDTRERLDYVFGATRLRTFLPLKVRFYSTLSEDAIDDLFLKLRCLRVLSFSGYRNIRKIPSTICYLKHLRYLNLSFTSIDSLSQCTSTLYNLQTLKLAHCNSLLELPTNLHRLVSLRFLDVSFTRIKELPESLVFLSNLQTLKLSNCHSLAMLPYDFHRLSNLRYLDVDECNLKEMPTDIGKLTRLQNLSTFVVGKDKTAKMGDLRELSNLRGMLHIKELENDVKPEDVLEAKLSEKKYLEKLKLEWNYHVSNDLIEHDVLDCLMPNTSLKELEIHRYGGREFPKWLGYQTFCNMVDLFLSRCEHCVTLPPLGRLSSLKILRIVEFNSLVTVGPEFYGNSSSMVKPFASLEVLIIEHMPYWKEWSMPVGDAVEAFPELRELSLHSCSSLTGDLPRSLPSLTELSISQCSKLVSSLPRMPNVTELTLVHNHDNIIRAMETDVLESLRCLQNLRIYGCPFLRLRNLPAALKMLKIDSSGHSTLRIQKQFNNSLQVLSLTCTKGSFRLFFVLNFFPNIRSLEIKGCPNLESLWVSEDGLSTEGLKSLSTLQISNCPTLTLFPTDIRPFLNLSSLKVEYCKKLKSLPEQMHNLLPSLESLCLRSCTMLKEFPTSGLPSSLRRLEIAFCKKLAASWKTWNLQRLVNLTNFRFSGCPCEDMGTFPVEGFLPPSLTDLSLSTLFVDTLDNNVLRQLTSLKQLFINDCPYLCKMTEEDFPSSLVSLTILQCPILQIQCQREIGEYWNKISHIPYIYINYKLV